MQAPKARKPEANLTSPQTPALVVAVAGMLTLAAAMGIGRFAYTPLLPPLLEALNWTVSQAGDVAGANYLGYVIGALVASMLVQRADCRRWLLLGLILSALTTTAGAWVVSFPAWLSIRFLSGIASAFCLVLGTTMVVEYLVMHARTQLTALHFSGVGIGIVISVFVIEAAQLSDLSVFGQWGAVGLAASALMLASWWILRRIEPRSTIPPQTATSKTPHHARDTQRLTKLIVAYGLFGFGYVVTATFIVTMARDLEHAYILEPLTWVVVGLCAAPSVLIYQRLAIRRGIFAVLRIAYGIEAVGVLLAGFGVGPAFLLTGGALLGGTFMGITALGLSAARQIAGNIQSQAIGWMTASFGLGQLFGPAVAGRLAEMTGGFAAPSLLAASLLLIGIGLLLGPEPKN